MQRSDDLVTMTHPRHPGVVRTITRATFERRSSKLGWVLVEDVEGEQPDPPVEAVPATPEDDGDREREQLIERAKQLGLRIHPRSKTDTIRTKIEAAENGSLAP